MDFFVNLGLEVVNGGWLVFWSIEVFCDFLRVWYGFLLNIAHEGDGEVSGGLDRLFLIKRVGGSDFVGVLILICWLFIITIYVRTLLIWVYFFTLFQPVFLFDVIQPVLFLTLLPGRSVSYTSYAFIKILRNLSSESGWTSVLVCYFL